MKIVEFKQAHSSNFTKGRKYPISHIVVHYVGAEGSAKANLSYFAGEGRQASAHYFVDHGPVAGVYQSVKEEDMAWHAGNSEMNHRSIGIELCCHKDSKGKWYFDKETVDTAVELVKVLMKKYNISSDRVIRHYDVTGKICPAPWVEDEKQWLDFKERFVEKEEVNDESTKEVIYNTVEEVPGYAKETIQKLINKGYLNGDGKGNYSLTLDMIRIFVVHDRMGLYDR